MIFDNSSKSLNNIEEFYEVSSYIYSLNMFSLRPWNTQLLLRCLHQMPPLKAQRIQKRRRQKECKGQRGWKTAEQGPLNQPGKVHMNSQMKEQAQGLNGSENPPSPHPHTSY